jgi:hypothetical protein
MDRVRETIIASICVCCIIYLGISWKQLKYSRDKEIVLSQKIDSLNHELFIFKIQSYDTRRASR